jgi:hypothetical protein
MDYDRHRKNQLHIAQKEFDEWINTLSESEKAAALHLRPCDEVTASGATFDSDPASYAIATESEFQEDPLDELREEFDVNKDTALRIMAWHKAQLRNEQISTQANTLESIIGALLSSKNPKMAAASLAFAAGLHTLHDIHSQAEYATKIGLSRQAVNKSVRAWKRLLNLNPSAFLKSEAAHTKLLKRNEIPHWRKKNASAANILTAIKNTLKKA